MSLCMVPVLAVAATFILRGIAKRGSDVSADGGADAKGELFMPARTPAPPIFVSTCKADVSARAVAWFRTYLK